MLAVAGPEGGLILHGRGGNQCIGYFEVVALAELPQILTRQLADLLIDCDAGKRRKQLCDDLADPSMLDSGRIRQGNDLAGPSG